MQPLRTSQSVSDRSPPECCQRSWDRVSLLWRVFAANVVVFVVAVALLAWTPVTVHPVARPGELVVLTLGLLAMLIVDLFLLRRAFGPLRRLTSLMTKVEPGARADGPRPSYAAAVRSRPWRRR